MDTMVIMVAMVMVVMVVRTGRDGTKLTFKLDFPGNLWLAAFAILAMFSGYEPLKIFIFTNHLTCQDLWENLLFFTSRHLWNKLSPSHLMLLLNPTSPSSPPTSDYIGREMEQFCDPRHFLDLSDHIRPISMQGRNAKEMDGKMEMACKEMNEQKIFALARIVRRTQLSFKEKELKSSFSSPARICFISE